MNFIKIKNEIINIDFIIRIVDDNQINKYVIFLKDNHRFVIDYDVGEIIIKRIKEVSNSFYIID